jgi:hypothetical protein
MTGRASMPRLLELAAERMREEEAILGGDPAFFERLAEKQRRRSDEWTAYHAGRGPRPRTGKLPDAHRERGLG